MIDPKLEQRLTEQTFEIGSVKLNYVEVSTFGTPMLLLNGASGCWQEFGLLIPHIENLGHVFALDMRGHGKSSWTKSYRLQDFYADIVAFIKCRIKEPTVLVGDSLGGLVTLLATAHYPDLVKAAIVVDSPLSQNSAQTNKFTESAVNPPSWSAKIAAKDLEASYEGFMLDPHPLPAFQVLRDKTLFMDLFSAVILADPMVTVATAVKRDETFAVYDVEKLFPQIQCPVLLLQGNAELGGLMSDDQVQRALELIPQAVHVKIENAGHLMYYQDLDAVLKAVIPFIKSVVY